MPWWSRMRWAISRSGTLTSTASTTARMGRCRFS
jgi:hypothetical protein